MTPPADQMREKRVELILQQLEELPTLPAVALRVLELTGQEESTTDEVVKLIESDPAMTARILQLVHRADVGVSGDVNSIQRAVVLLGFDAVRSAVLAPSVFQVFSGPSPLPGRVFNRDEFWKHSIAVACGAELLATSLNQSGGAKSARIDPSEAFL